MYVQVLRTKLNLEAFIKKGCWKFWKIVCIAIKTWYFSSWILIYRHILYKLFSQAVAKFHESVVKVFSYLMYFFCYNY